jgi:carbonic anhydrase
MSEEKANISKGKLALSRLLEGNRRFVEAKRLHPNQTDGHRNALLGSQHPFATILGCSDSRVPPEIIFDQGLGDLFVIRVAGNIIDDTVLASLEYAAEHLHSPLLMVLSHENCGAVKAALDGGELEGHLPSTTQAILAALKEVEEKPGNPLDNAVRAHARITAERLRSSKPILSKLVESGELTVVAAYYKLDTGIVEIL